MKRLDLLSGASSTLPYKEFRSGELLSIDTGSSSKGNQCKYLTRDRRFYVKELFDYQGHLWRDDLVESIASRYAAMCNLPSGVSVVSQGMCTVDGRPASYSQSFRKQNETYISYRRLMRSRIGDDFSLVGIPEECFSTIVSTCSDVIGQDATGFVQTMLLLDLIVANEDRHLNNFGFMVGTDGGIRFAPLFDFGLGLFEGDLEYDSYKSKNILPDIRLKPCWFRMSSLLEFLLDTCGSVLAILPSTICLSDFQFPSELAKEYFSSINRKLGVKIVQ